MFSEGAQMDNDPAPITLVPYSFRFHSDVIMVSSP